ncbi:aminotransferase class I/II-fold pyridoxal phosphate-dependent enzyme [soil metagenome]
MVGKRGEKREAAGDSDQGDADGGRSRIDAAASREGSVQYNVGRMRMDAWNRLRDAGRRLAEVQKAGDDVTPWREAVGEALEVLRPYEPYWAFPGLRTFEKLEAFFQQGAHEAFARHATRIVQLLAKSSYRRIDLSTSRLSEYADLVNISRVVDAISHDTETESRPYFEVLLVDDLTPQQETELRLQLRTFRAPEDDFIYELVVVRSFEDAMTAVLLNCDIQSAVVRYIFPFHSRGKGLDLTPEADILRKEKLDSLAALLGSERSRHLGGVLKNLRPDLNAFLVTDSPLERMAGEKTENYDRLFHRQDYYRELHLSILAGVADRAETPFLTALQRYSRKPTGVFHALPIGQGKSILKSRWIRDTSAFFGPSGFMGETSATTGGLDSLLQPHGPLKRAQELAARAFGAKKTYFVTNGTSTANKIVMQGLIRPGDIVLLAHDCHKSHPYAVIMSGALPVYLDAYPLSEYSMYGGVPLRGIKEQLLALRKAGKLDRVKMLLLTNITFDGISYDPVRVMEEVLAIKPDMVFVWDEAWFAYGRFHPTLRRRTAMDAARRRKSRLQSEDYRKRYRAWHSEFEQIEGDDHKWVEERLLPDPDAARVRVYATQSTHKTLTALRQGSMIHVRDQDFDQKVSDAFEEAYMTHTSTSPNYPILASLDMGRRQVELEGYALVQESIEIAMTLRERIHCDPLLRRYFRILGPRDMVPAPFRPSGLDYYFDPDRGWARLTPTWRTDEFTLDPTRITLHIGGSGMDGSQFKQMLMDRFSIQVNKTSRNTVLFLTHIGTTPATAAHLVKSLTQVARDLDETLPHQSDASRRLHEERVRSLTEELPPLPYFSRFHEAFRPDPEGATPEGDMRKAFFLAYDAESCGHLKLDASLEARVEAGEEIVSASFVTPYPPGFPVLVPGQVMTPQILAYLRALDVKEIHGYRPEFGLRIFRPEALGNLVRDGVGAQADTKAVKRADAKGENGIPAAELSVEPATSEEITQARGN